jgi:hypothetical protein
VADQLRRKAIAGVGRLYRARHGPLIADPRRSTNPLPRQLDSASGATVVTAAGFARAYRAHSARPVTEKTDSVPEARLDLAAGLIFLDARPWHRLGAPVPWPEVVHDAALLAPYFEGFGQFSGATHEMGWRDLTV